MDWKVDAPEFDIKPFCSVETTAVLYDFDGPRIFAASSSLGELLYFLSDEEALTSRFIIAPTKKAYS